MSKPTFNMTHCDGCEEPVIDSIQMCACCNDRYVAKFCHNCERGWGWDYRTKQWVELEEVKDD
jgi:hypothetical protein